MIRTDIRKNDMVKIRSGLTPEEKQRISKFGGRIFGEDIAFYLEQILRNPQTTYKVEETKQTMKKPTQYSVLVTRDAIRIPIQSRYLTLHNRKPAHPLTKIFQD